MDMITSAKRAVDAVSTLLGKRKQKGPGDIDGFEHDKKESDDRVGGILGVE
ncbi:MAG: hypothetical protein LBS87_02495 [Puniceicoccales bacterium]|nr:hypothetical protein [Puniceicoccales bacterium]